MFVRVVDKKFLFIFARLSQENQTAGLSRLLFGGCMFCLQSFGKYLTVVQHKVVVEDG